VFSLLGGVVFEEMETRISELFDIWPDEIERNENGDLREKREKKKRAQPRNLLAKLAGFLRRWFGHFKPPTNRQHERCSDSRQKRRKKRSATFSSSFFFKPLRAPIPFSGLLKRRHVAAGRDSSARDALVVFVFHFLLTSLVTFQKAPRRTTSTAAAAAANVNASHGIRFARSDAGPVDTIIVVVGSRCSTFIGASNRWFFNRRRRYFVFFFFCFFFFFFFFCCCFFFFFFCCFFFSPIFRWKPLQEITRWFK
jgi:hypothetical protein